MLDIAHKLIENIEPAIAAFKTPAHTSFLHALVAVHHHLWILLTKQFI
jgi:hypothetical protein